MRIDTVERLVRRSYNSQPTERQDINDSEDMPFLDGLHLIPFDSKSKKDNLATSLIAVRTSKVSETENELSSTAQCKSCQRVDKYSSVSSEKRSEKVSSIATTKLEEMGFIAERLGRNDTKAKFFGADTCTSGPKHTISHEGDSAVAVQSRRKTVDPKASFTKSWIPQNNTDPAPVAPTINKMPNSLGSQVSWRSSDIVNINPAQNPVRQDTPVISLHSSQGTMLHAGRSNSKAYKVSIPDVSNYGSSVVVPAVGGVERTVRRVGNNISDIDYEEKPVPSMVRKLLAKPSDQKVQEPQRAMSKSIYILGNGVVGKFIAHCLLGIPEPPSVTLLLHRPLLMQQWYDEGGTIKLIKDDMVTSKSQLEVESSAAFDALNTHPLSGAGSHSYSVIEHLIVTTDGPETVSALSSIKHRLTRYSTVCFIQGGLGIIDLVNSSLFPNPANRPYYMLGAITHDLQSTASSFTVWERRPGSLSLCVVPRSRPGVAQLVRRVNLPWAPAARYLLYTLCRVPELQGRGLLPREFFKMQLERLAINSVLGPLSVVYNCTNDQLLHNYQVSRTMKLLINDISLIIRQLPEISHLRDTDQHFCPERLESIILSVIEKTGNNRTSMLQAVMDGRKTNIDFYNGYLLDRAAELGIGCPSLEMVVSLVKGKQAISSREKTSYIPFGEN